MVSYYNHAAMYRQPQVSGPNGHFQPMNPWYHQSYHSNPQLTASSTYCVQDDQSIWHASHVAPAISFHPDYQEYGHNGMQQMQYAQVEQVQQNIPSPTITVSGSDMSSPGAHSGTISPQLNHSQNNSRPSQVRSPYEWIKKSSYQSQPNPGKTRTKDKYRVVYTDSQRMQLEKEFALVNKYITIRRKSELASRLGLSERQIKIWFQNRRAKERKQSKKQAEEKAQAQIANNSTYQQTMLNQHQPIQHMELQNQQAIIPNIIPSSNVIMQRFIENPATKLEISENEPMV